MEGGKEGERWREKGRESEEMESDDKCLKCRDIHIDIWTVYHINVVQGRQTHCFCT